MSLEQGSQHGPIDIIMREVRRFIRGVVEHSKPNTGRSFTQDQLEDEGLDAAGPRLTTEEVADSYWAQRKIKESPTISETDPATGQDRAFNEKRAKEIRSGNSGFKLH